MNALMIANYPDQDAEEAGAEVEDQLAALLND